MCHTLLAKGATQSPPASQIGPWSMGFQTTTDISSLKWAHRPIHPFPLLSNPKPLPTLRPLAAAIAGGRITDGQCRCPPPPSSPSSIPSPSSVPPRAPPPLSAASSSSPFAAACSHDRLTSSSPDPWLEKWPAGNAEPSSKLIRREDVPDIAGGGDRDRGRGAIERIVLRLQNLGLGEDGEEGETGGLPLDGEQRLGDLVNRRWVRPDLAVLGVGEESSPLPWERDEEGYDVGEGGGGVRRTRVKAPTLAELTIEDSELRRFRREGIVLRERITIPKA